MARTKNQSARREQLARATEEALRHRGPQELRYRDIAEAAGLTAPAVSYYFSELDLLISDTYERVTSRYLDRRRQSLIGIKDPKTKLATLIECGLPTGPGDHDVLLTYQMAGNPTIANSYGELAARLFNSEIEMYCSVIESCPVRPGRTSVTPDLIARCLVSMEDSLGLRIVLGDDGYERSAAVGEIRSVACALTGLDLPQVPPFDQII